MRIIFSDQSAHELHFAFATFSCRVRHALTWRILRNSRVANNLLLSLWLKSHSQRHYPIHPVSLPTVRMQRKRPIYMQPTKKKQKKLR